MAADYAGYSSCFSPQQRHSAALRCDIYMIYDIYIDHFTIYTISSKYLDNDTFFCNFQSGI